MWETVPSMENIKKMYSGNRETNQFPIQYTKKWTSCCLDIPEEEENFLFIEVEKCSVCCTISAYRNVTEYLTFSWLAK